MLPFKKNALAIACSYPMIFGLGMSSFTNAEEAAESIEEVVLVGTRGKPRSITDSPAPVDVISSEALSNQGSVDMSSLIRNVVPSFNVNDQPISDAGTLVRPANLRGLSPDHTLVMINGKRRHRAAVITWLGNGISNGSQGADIATIPSLAVKGVEVLRDGAAAQYGSDAIAGVMNFSLKDANSGGTVEARVGQFTEGDGTLTYVSGNIGLPLGSNGFANLTVEYGNQEDTDRSIQRGDAQALIDVGAPYEGIADPAQIWGLPKVENDLKLFANFGSSITDTVEVYGYGNYNQKHVDGGFYFRNPSNRGGVYSNDDGATLLVGDLTPNDSNGCPIVTITDLVPDPVALQQVKDDPNCFTFLETIPGGFTPRFGGDLTDTSFQVGVRGDASEQLSWDLSAYWGMNEADFFINNTLNASLGPDSPRDFDPGAYKQEDINLNADATYTFTDNLVIGFGAEYRIEKFTITAGQEESYNNGILADQGFSTSSNGFPGFPEQSAGSWDRSNSAVYLDGQWDPTDFLILQAAARYENFEDFGTTFNYKLGANIMVSETGGLRSTFSTGFKAPTPGQANASNTSTEFTNGKLVNNGTIPSTNPLALSKGGKELEPEKSTNFALGFYASLGIFDVTVDYFDIKVEDRLNLSKEVELTEAEIEQLIADNVPGAGDLANFRFFINDFDTRTRGLDIIATTSIDWVGTTDWSLAANFTETKVIDYNPDTVNEIRIKQIEDTTPSKRINLTANHRLNDFRVLARASLYGGWYDAEARENFSSETIIDLEGEYNLTANQTILLGVNNLFDEKGDEVSDPFGAGNLYSQYTPFGFNGRFAYLKYQYSW